MDLRAALHESVRLIWALFLFDRFQLFDDEADEKEEEACEFGMDDIDDEEEADDDDDDDDDDEDEDK